MTSVLSVLNRCLAIEFYRQNAGFFGLLILIVFGFIKTSEHVAIGAFLVANPATLLFLYLIWILYGIKVALFVGPAISKKENNFLAVFSLLPMRIMLKSALGVSLTLVLPVIAYGAFLITLAIPNQFYGAITSILVAFFVLVIGLSLFIFIRLSNSHSEKVYLPIPLFSKFARPSWLFFIEYLLRKEPVLFTLSKAYSCLVIIGASALYKTDQFDLRLITTGVLLSFVGNASILHKYCWFLYQKLKYTLNLPISFARFATNQVVMWMLILLPETIIVLRYYPLASDMADITGLVFFGFGITILSFSFLLLKQLELSQFITRIFWLIVISTFLILFSIHPLILGFLYLFIAVAILYFWRIRFEYIEKLR